MSDTPSLGSPHEHIYTTDIRTWDKAKAYARENRKAPTPAEARLWRSCAPPGWVLNFAGNTPSDFLLSILFASVIAFLLRLTVIFTKIPTRPSMTVAAPTY